MHVVCLLSRSNLTPHHYYSEVKLPEKTAEVGSKTVPKVPPPTSTLPSVAESDVQSAGVMGTTMGLFVPPNMSEVFYKDSYEEFIRVKQPVEVRAHAWTPKQSIYVGCGGGQLILVEFDTGCTTLLVNAQPPVKVGSGTCNVLLLQLSFAGKWGYG